MRRSEVFPSKYLTADDIPAEGLIVTIHHVEEENMRDGKPKPIAYFEELDKGLVINVTKWGVIESLTGEADTDDWTGARIRIYPSETTYDGDVVACINVDKKRPKTTTPPAAAKNGKKATVAETAGALKTAAREPGDDEDEDNPGF